jgi:hypothetical protein
MGAKIVSHDSDSILEVLTRLIQLTQADELKWAVCQTPAPRDPEGEKNDTAFCAQHYEKRLRLYEQSIRMPKESNAALFLHEWSKRHEWRFRVVLEIVDDNMNTLWAFPSHNAGKDLLNAVRYQVAGVEAFVKELLD